MTAFVLALARRSTTTENQSRVQVTTSYIASSRFFDGLEDLDSIRGPTLDVLLGLFQVDLDDNVETLLRHCYETISRSKGKEHSPLDRLSSTLGISKVRSGLQTSMIFQNLPSLKPSLNDEQEITMELGREHMATSSCIFLQVTPSKDKLTFRTAFDDRLVSSDEAHRLVDDMRCLIQIMASMKERPARELMSAVPERAKAIAELPRPQPLELFDLTPVNGGYWIRRLLRNLWWMFWYHLVLWPIRKRRL
ncbi:hypothetical protein [Sporisorium scitamineum]|nr:hypothetical protein [Sporisorium scitamineum]